MHRRCFAIVPAAILLALLAAASVQLAGCGGADGKQAERQALVNYVDALRPALEGFNSDATAIKSRYYVSVYVNSSPVQVAAYAHAISKAALRFSSALSQVEAPERLAALQEAGLREMTRIGLAFRRMAHIFDHLVAVKHTAAETRAHQATIQRIFAAFSEGTPALDAWGNAIGAEAQRLGVPVPQWVVDLNQSVW